MCAHSLVTAVEVCSSLLTDFFFSELEHTGRKYADCSSFLIYSRCVKNMCTVNKPTLRFIRPFVRQKKYGTVECIRKVEENFTIREPKLQDFIKDFCELCLTFLRKTLQE